MRTFMLTWNPGQERPADLSAALDAIGRGRTWRDDWSTGVRKDLPIGSRVFLVRQGVEPRGVVAAGYTLTEPALVEGREGQSHYCNVAFTAALDASVGHLIPLAELAHTSLLVNVPWGIAGGGREFTAAEAAQLEAHWSAVLRRLGQAEVPHESSRRTTL
jgi:5-methylcytosine-specific restriction protein A